MAELLLATTNPGKVAELRALLVGLPYRVLGLSDLPQNIESPAETGETFADNARLKAGYYHENSGGMLTLADDSGLCVDALDGAPGVYSARYAGEGATSAEMVATLLANLRDVPMEARSARFICAIALIGRGIDLVFEGSCEGTIATAPRGSGGFGYDPVFIDAETGVTFAELAPEQKSARSHRGRALGLARDYLFAVAEENRMSRTRK
jgi:XTP/dITP diphosphohydrolase